MSLNRQSLMKQPLSKLAMIAVALAMCVVVLGAFTRLVDAGLGCPDWPGCYGHLMWPDSAEDVARAEARFPDAPVEHDKTWPEMVHRYFAGSLGLLLVAIAFTAWRQGRAVKLSLGLVALVTLQAVFGMWTVTLKLWPQVVTAHLLGGFATLSLIWLLLQRLGGWHWQDAGEAQASLSKIKPLALLALLIVIAQIALGGWTSSNYAALACPDLPQCLGSWWPPADFARGFNLFQHIGPNYLGGLLDNQARTAIHMTHRLGAILVTIVLLLLACRLWLSRFRPAQILALVVLAGLTVQILLGLSNIYWALPLGVAVAHNAGGVVLLLILVTVNHRLYSLSSATRTS